MENLLLIERAQLRLAAGLNVLTGETGAGKTVLAGALDLLLGGRSRPGIVRPGAAEAYVEGVFDLPDSLRAELGERLPADADEVVLARRVGADGRTRAYLNGRTATVGELRDLGGALVSFYGQHEHRKLTLAAAQLEILDGLCGSDQVLRLRAAAHAFAETTRLRAELGQLRELAGARERELDLLEYELAEIDSAAPAEQEHEELLAARERLRRLDALCSAAGAGAEALAPESSEFPGVAQLAAGALSRLDALTGVDPRLDVLAERLRSLFIESGDLAVELRRYGEQADSGIGGEHRGLQEIEERLTVIERLMRKHGGSIEAVLEHGERARARRDELAGAEVALEHVQTEIETTRGELGELGATLTEGRHRAAPGLAEAVRARLADLAMEGAAFDVELVPRADGCGPAGAETVELMIAPNPGVPAAPLREIASGGEVSRVMLALLSAAHSGPPADAPPVAVPLLVFDEVDAGIGGHTARAVGEHLRALASSRQLLCITHLPQVASLAQRHFRISKMAAGGTASTEVLELGGDQVVAELVRMLGAAEDDRAASQHARKLLRAA